MERDIKKMISAMTLEEKASLCSGGSFWTTQALPRHGIPSIMMTDGPHGLRKQGESADHLGINDSMKTTCFPTAAGIAASWNREIAHKLGVALGEECQAEDVQIILGPGANIKRSPLCGRNFEYYSEDPYLSSELAAEHIQGVQSQGIGTSLKHFAVNNQETKRFSIDAVVDERTLRELYLASFEGAVKKSQPWTVMCAYNQINGSFCSQNKMLLTDILKEEWGFSGFVVSDWGAVNERELALEAGLELEMPTSGGEGAGKIVQAIQNGRLSEKVLDNAVERLLHMIFKAADSKKEGAVYDKEVHHRLAREIAAESMVLLKNEGNMLPLAKNGKLAVIGAFAKNPRYQGAGSSRINPNFLDIPYEELQKSAADAVFSYAEGYSLKSAEVEEDLFREARETAKAADIAIVFAGLPDKYDSEGTDRKDMGLPMNQNALIEAVTQVQKNTIVVLINGSAVEMPWIEKVCGVLEAYLGGQAMAGAIADLLFGDVNPSGKLAESFPEKTSHNPSFINFPGEKMKVEYREGLFVGYRYYDKVETAPLFPFGHGLSYTSFEYSKLRIDKQELFDTEQLHVRVSVKNIGTRAGKEAVQLYVRDVESSVLRPVKELKGFEKVSLEPGEEKEVTFVLDKRAFAYYNVDIKDWHVESGNFEILIGKSSRDIVLSERIHVKSSVKIKKNYTVNSTLEDIKEEPAAQQLVAMIRQSMAAVEESIGMDVEALLSSIKIKSLIPMAQMMGQSIFTQEMLDGLLMAMNQGE